MILGTRDIIEQIQRGNVPDGYKKTKAGILPADLRRQKILPARQYHRPEARTSGYLTAQCWRFLRRCPDY